MAVAPSTLAKVDNILKEVYEDKVRDQLQSEILTLKRIETTTEGVSEDVGGKYVRFPVRVSRNHGHGSRREMEALPNARNQGYASAQVSLAYEYGSLQLTGQIFELADRNPQAFASALDLEMNGLRETLAKDMNRQVYGSTLTGSAVATADVAGTTTTLVFSNVAGKGKWAEVDQLVDLYTATTSNYDVNGPFTISSVVKGATNTTITYSPASVNAPQIGDFMSLQGSGISATSSKEIKGFRDIVLDSGVLFNIDPATYPVWKSVNSNNGGTARALSEGLMIKMVDDIRVNGARPSVIFTSLGVRRSYFNLLVQQREFVNTKSFTGGFEGLAFAGAGGEIPVIEDVDAVNQVMFFITEKELKLYQAGDWGFMNRDGSNWSRVIGQTGGVVGKFDAYDATMYKYCQLGTHRRNAHGILSDITEG
jgi:hypothetical protein